MYTIIGIAAVLFGVAAVWIFASRFPCPAWLRWLVELDNPLTRTNRAAVIIEHLDLEPGMVVLDFGCGPGRVTLPLARQVGETGEVVAVDIQAGMLDRARNKARAAALTNISFVHAGCR